MSSSDYGKDRDRLIRQARERAVSAADPQPPQRHNYRLDVTDHHTPIVCECGRRFSGFIAWSQHVERRSR